MSVIEFPFRFSFEQARKQAKDLQRDLRAGVPTAMDRLRAVHPDGERTAPTRLSDAQLVIAREHGFESWVRMKRYAQPETMYQNEMITEGMNEVINGPWEDQLVMLNDLASEALRHCGIEPSRMSRAGHMGNFGFSDYALAVVTDGSSPSYLVTVHYTYDDVFSFDEMHRQVASLCAWLHALDRDTELDIQAPVPDRTGALCQRIDHRPDGPAAVCTVQHWVKGRDIVGPEWDGRVIKPGGCYGIESDAVRKMGVVLATIHTHGRTWPRPDGFNRLQTDWVEDLSEPEMKYWDTGKRDPEEARIVRTAMEEVARYRKDQGEPWGLTHGDYRVPNIVVDGSEYKPIDFDFSTLSHQFDDVGFFLIDMPEPRLRDAFLNGYESVSPQAASFQRLVEGTIIAGRVRRCAWDWGEHFPERLVPESISYLAGESFLLRPYCR